MLTIIEQLQELPWSEAFSHRALEKARKYANQNRVQIHDLERQHYYCELQRLRRKCL